MGKKILITENQYDKLFDASRGIFEIMIPTFYKNPLSFMMGNDVVINEGLIKTYPFEDMERYVRQYFNIPSHYFNPYKKNGIMCVAIDLDKDDFLIGEVDRAMNLCGYIKSISVMLDDKIRVHYEPKFQEEVKDDGDYMQHLTNYMNIPRIMKIGLVPSHKNKMFNYLDSIYLFSKDISENDLKDFSYKLSMTQTKAFDTKLYAVLKIKNDGSYRLHKDPNFEGGFWTSDNIPPSLISKDIDYLKI